MLVLKAGNDFSQGGIKTGVRLEARFSGGNGFEMMQGRTVT